MNLQDRNTLGLPARTDRLIAITQLDQLEALDHTLANQPRCILGGGSNVVLHAPLSAVVLHNRLLGKSISPEGVLTCASGEGWHELVMWSLAQGFAGLENLALIPGTVGAAPVQNIGAYGVELADLLIDVGAWDFLDRCHVRLSRDACRLGYRDSVFKDPAIQGPWDRPRYFITEVRLRLTPAHQAALRIHYNELSEHLHRDHPDGRISALDVAMTVIRIRQHKLPDPQKIGNVGSFFKNPVVSPLQARHLKLLHPDLPQYPATSGHDTAVKISAAWLIERCGFKGARRGDVGVYDQHALVLVNHGGGTGREILALAQEIQQAVVAKFGVFLEPEPVFMPAISR